MSEAKSGGQPTNRSRVTLRSTRATVTQQICSPDERSEVPVARMSEAKFRGAADQSFPGYAALHPGYTA